MRSFHYALLAAAILIAALGDPSAEAQELRPGDSARELYKNCAGIERMSDPSLDPMEFSEASAGAMRCEGFMRGFTDGWRLRIEIPVRRYPVSDAERDRMQAQLETLLPSPFCFPTVGLPIERVIDAFAGYYKLHRPPENTSARILLVEALTAAFPCSRKQPVGGPGN